MHILFTKRALLMWMNTFRKYLNLVYNSSGFIQHVALSKTFARKLKAKAFISRLLLWIPQSFLFSFPVLSFLTVLPSPFSQLLSVSPCCVQGSISFNNLHIHDSHREWHPAGLDHNAKTQPEHNISPPVLFHIVHEWKAFYQEGGDTVH